MNAYVEIMVDVPTPAQTLVAPSPAAAGVALTLRQMEPAVLVRKLDGGH